MNKMMINNLGMTIEGKMDLVGQCSFLVYSHLYLEEIIKKH
ncbi:hypothetical protein RJG79_08490 [Mycoplasmatota bacterium WC44]